MIMKSRTLLNSGFAVIYRDGDGYERVIVYKDRGRAETFLQQKKLYQDDARIVTGVPVYAGIQMTTDERRLKMALAKAMWGAFYRCPTTGKIIEGMHGDDKALCNCGHSNPKVPQEQTERTSVHVVGFLQTASAEEYVDEREQK